MVQRQVAFSLLCLLFVEVGYADACCCVGMAVFAEDQIVSVPVLGPVWTSMGGPELSPIKLRQWTSQLLSRSILLGSVSDGVSM